MISYAPVSAFAFDIVGDVFTGYAAPAGSRQPPCQVVLMSDATPIAYSRAARFSPRAEAEGHKRGWCGFSLPGRAIAMGLGDNVQIRCGVTDRVLAQPAFDPAVFTTPPVETRQLSVIEMVAFSRDGESCVDLDQLATFARYHLHRHGTHSFLNATYQMFFGRDADHAVVDAWMKADDPDAEVDQFLEGLVESREFMAKPFGHLPGPFQTQFRYDRGLIG